MCRLSNERPTTSGCCLKRKECPDVHGFYSDYGFTFNKVFATKKACLEKSWVMWFLKWPIQLYYIKSLSQSFTILILYTYICFEYYFTNLPNLNTNFNVNFVKTSYNLHLSSLSIKIMLHNGKLYIFRIIYIKKIANETFLHNFY